MELKGSIFLRSNHMEYSPVVLTSNWDQRREAEPKDYDITKESRRNVHTATYQHFGTYQGVSKTGYQEQCEQVSLKPLYQEQQNHCPLLQEESLNHINWKREMGAPNCGYGSVLPCHPADRNKRYLDTTQRTNYKTPYPYISKPIAKSPSSLQNCSSIANKKCISQFTDTADYRRPGQNTWQDESGLYGNSQHKSELQKPTLTGMFSSH